MLADVPSGWPSGFAAASVDRDAALVLACLRGATPRRLIGASVVHPTASALLAAVRRGKVGSDLDRRIARATAADQVRERLAACDARYAVVGDSAYPAGLTDLVDPPVVVFSRGRDLRTSPASSVAIVGARAASPTGRDIAAGLARDVAAAGVAIISGAARGIDAAAHEGALDGRGRTLAVLGSGIDVAYPPGSRSLLARIARSGTLVSEYPPGVPAEPFRFPARNRLIAALGRGVVIVEGELGSGSMITAEHALDLGREVMAVPGSVVHPLAAVPNALIREGASLVRDAMDVLAQIGVEAASAAVGDGGELDPRRSSILGAVHARSTVDSIAAAVRLPVEQVHAALLALEFDGLIRQVGGRYERTYAVGRLNPAPRLGTTVKSPAPERPR